MQGVNPSIFCSPQQHKMISQENRQSYQQVSKNEFDDIDPHSMSGTKEHTKTSTQRISDNQMAASNVLSTPKSEQHLQKGETGSVLSTPPRSNPLE